MVGLSSCPFVSFVDRSIRDLDRQDDAARDPPAFCVDRQDQPVVGDLVDGAAHRDLAAGDVCLPDAERGGAGEAHRIAPEMDAAGVAGGWLDRVRGGAT